MGICNVFSRFEILTAWMRRTGPHPTAVNVDGVIGFFFFFHHLFMEKPMLTDDCLFLYKIGIFKRVLSDKNVGELLNPSKCQTTYRERT